MNCCKNKKIKDLTQGLGEERHFFCVTCRAHYWRGVFYDRKQWEAYIGEGK